MQKMNNMILFKSPLESFQMWSAFSNDKLYFFKYLIGFMFNSWVLHLVLLFMLMNFVMYCWYDSVEIDLYDMFYFKIVPTTQQLIITHFRDKIFSISFFSEISVVLNFLVFNIKRYMLTTVSVNNFMWLKFYLTYMFFVLFCNILGLLPYSYTFTSCAVLVFFISLSIFMLTLVVGVLVNGWKMLGMFLPNGVPYVLAPLIVFLEFFSFFASVLSLSMRLFANMLSGHTLIKVLISLCWGVVSLSFLGLIFGLFASVMVLAVFFLELMVAMLQFFVFTTLSSLYFKDMLFIH